MKKLIKGVTIIFLSATLFASIWYQNNHERFRTGIISSVETLLSDITGISVTIGSVSYVPPFSISLNEIKIYSDEMPDAAIKISKAIVSIRIEPFLKKGILETFISLPEISLNEPHIDIKLDLLAEIPLEHSGKFLLSDSVFIEILNGKVFFGKHAATDISGYIKTENSILYGSEILFTLDEETLLFQTDGPVKDLSFISGSVRAKDYTLKASFCRNSDTLTIKKFTGILFDIIADVKGEISHISEPGNRQARSEGHLTGAIKDLIAALPRETEIPAIFPDNSNFTLSFDLKIPERAPAELSLSSHIKISSLILGDIEITDISGDLNAQNGTISSEETRFYICGYPAGLLITADIGQDGIPLEFKAYSAIEDIMTFSSSVIADSSPFRGTFDLDISFSGKVTELHRAWQHFNDTGSYAAALALLPSSVVHFKTGLEEYVKDTLSVKNIRTELILQKGYLHIPITSFDVLGGKLEAKGGISLREYLMPYEMDISMSGIDLKRTADMFGIPAHLSYSPINAEFSLSGRSQNLRKIREYVGTVKLKDNEDKNKKINAVLVHIAEQGLFEKQKVWGSVRIPILDTGKIKLYDLYVNMVFDEGNLTFRDIEGDLYNGDLNGYIFVDLGRPDMPFYAETIISGTDIRSLSEDASGQRSRIYGTLDLTADIKGLLIEPDSYTGKGKFEIYDANLGRVPILTPLLGWIYEGLENIFPAFRKINITHAHADLWIADRKIKTNNLTLTGSDICLTATGSLGFDGKLDFFFENELLEQTPIEETEWPVAIRNFITNFGRTISRARLRGTLTDQKWDFEYLSSFRKNIGDHLRSFWEGITR